MTSQEKQTAEPAVHVADLTKTYRVPVREGGVVAALKSLVNRKTRDVEAVREISFEVEHGEIVGFLGPNGAGKTTSLKMLSGLLYPTAGEVSLMYRFTIRPRHRAGRPEALPPPPP